MINNNTTENYISQIVLPPIEDEENERLYLIKDKKAQNDIEILQSNLTSLNEEVNTLDTKVNDIEIPDISNLVTINNLNNTVSNFITRAELDNNYVKWSTLNSNYSTDFELNNTYAHTTNGVIDNATVDYTDVNNLYDNYAHVDNNNTIDNASINYTKVDNLYNNYAHINNGTIDNANINQANVNDLNTNYAHITNGTIDNASINYTDINNLNNNYAHINNGVIDNATIDNANVNDLDTNYAHITSGIIDNATIDQANVNNLNTNYAHIVNGKIDNATIDQANVENLNTNYAHINNGIIDNATIDQANVENLNNNYAHINNGVIDNARIDQAQINNLNTNYAHITNGQIDNARIDYGNINHLDSHYAHISEGVIDNATISQANVDQLDAFYAEIDMANVNNAWIENGVIKDAAISDAKIIGISANKITAGTIDASNVNVANLRADNLIVTRINGQPVIGGYTLVHSSISNYLERNPSQEGWYEFSNNVYTLSTDIVVDETKVYYRSSDSIELYDQATIDGMVDGLNARIDSQIETWTTDAVPTLNNYPAEDWTTNALKQEHIGDICYVINAGNNYDGFTYRFAYDNTSQQYMWVLIKDNQVTAALGRLVTAEGKITGLENFESTTSTWINQTDQGLETIRSNYTTLSGRVDKTVKSTVQLWFTKANTTAPTAPISVVTNNNATGANSYNQWNLTVPEYNANYPYYYYCWQYTFEDDTTGWSAVIYDRATTETQSTARATSSSLSNYITNNDAALAALQSQVDNQLEVWYGNSNPTNSTQPASSWDSDEKANHIGDLYYNTTDGSAWQWAVNNSTYSWTQIPDSAASAALAAAQDAQATADGKRRIFTSTPTVPYDIGDLWVTGNQVKYATVKKIESQSYAAADWSQTATDDTMASANIKSSVQLWYTSNSTTPPNKPYTDGSSSYVNSTSTNSNTWTTVVPLYNSSTPKYHYCYQQQRGDGKYQWTIPVYDDATTTAMAKAQSALPAATFETFEQSTFKDVVDTVDEQSSTITTLTTITENNGLTTSTNITNAVNSVSETATSNSSKISNLTQVLGTNADGTAATNDMIHQVSEIEQDLDGITTRVGKTESALRGSYATCSTATGTQAKVATVFPTIENYELYAGETITVKFTNSNTSSSAPTLNVNNTGAKAIKTYSGADLSEAEYKWDAGATMTFVYDGTNWRIQDSTELTRIKNAESSITQTANSITSLVANTATYTAPDGTTQTNTIKSAIQQNADDINLRVEKSGVIAAINASVETNGTSAVKISADKVNIEGATIFNSGRLSQTSLNNTYASINDIPSDLSDLTDNNNVIPSDMSDLTDNNNIIPSDISNLTDNNSIIPSDISDLTDNNNVIPDISGKADESSAIAEEQLIYIQAVSGTNSINAYPQTATTTSSYWVTQTGESIPSGTPPNSNTGQTPRWTLKRPSYQTNYPVIFTAKQRKTVSGVITCSTPLKDDTLTIIDGGHITTGTIDASQVTVNNIHADSITVGTINGTQITNGAISFDKLDNNVKNDINTISNAATTALNNLATIENVIDTLTWVTEHGTMTSTTDVTVDPTKIYFILDNNGDYTVGNNKYSIVQEPNTTALSNYYELTIDKSIQNYIATHLSLTNEGLWLTPMATNNGYKVLIATESAGSNYSAGTYIIDNSGTVIAQFTGTGISFAQNKPFTIGDSNAYIYFDGNGHINIGGSNVTIGGNTTLQQLLNKYDSTITSNDISVSKSGDTATITIGNNSVNIVDGATGGRWYAGTNITGVSTTSKSFSGSGITSAVIGDMYLNTSTYNTYRCTVAGGPSVAKWVYINNIKGTSFTNAEHQYYLSTSTQNAPLQNDSGWSTTPATYIEGHYYWERWKITLSNPNSVQYTTPVLAQEITSAWAAIEKTNEEINLRATKTEMYQSAQPNLAPIGSVDFSNIYNANTNPNGYWHTALNTQNSWFTQLDDGWIHVYINNSEGIEDIDNLNFNPDACPSIIPGNTYTILTEIRNNDSLGTDESNTNFYLNEVNNNQFWGNAQNEQIDDEYVTTTTNVNLLTCGQTNSLYSYRLADVSHIANINEAKVDSGIVGRAIVITDSNSSSQNNNDNPSPILFNYVFQCAAGSILDFDFRMSLYDGIYSGPYKPYSGPQLYSSQAELKVQADRIGMIVANDNAESNLQLTSNALTYIGNNIEIKNSNGTSTVISGGNIQTGSINIGSLDSSVTTPIENAATTATNYISIDPVSGIRIADANPGTTTTYQHQTATETEFVVNNVSRTRIGSDGLRIGGVNESHVVIDGMSQTFYDGNQNEVFKIKSGYIEEETMSDRVAVIITPTDRITDPDALYIYRIDINDTTLSDEDWTVLDDGVTIVFTSAVSGDISIYYSGPSGSVYYQAPQVVIGDDNGKNHMYLDYQTMQMIDSAGNAYFNISNPSSSSGLMRMGYATGNRVEVTANGVATRSGSSNNYTLVDSTGFKAYLSNALRMALDGTALKVYDGSGTAIGNVLASFGETTVIGKQGGQQVISSSGGLRVATTSYGDANHQYVVGANSTFITDQSISIGHTTGISSGVWSATLGSEKGELAWKEYEAGNGIMGVAMANQSRFTVSTFSGKRATGNMGTTLGYDFVTAEDGIFDQVSTNGLVVDGNIYTDATMTNHGASFITRTGAVNYNTTLSENTNGTGYYFRELSGSDNIAYIRSYGRSGSDRKRGLQIGGHNINNSNWNMLYLLTDKDGNRIVQVSESKPWRDAINPSPLEESNPSAVSVASGTRTTLGSITISAGIWVIAVSVTFAANDTGRRSVYFGPSSTGDGITYNQMASFTMAPAVGGMTKYSTSTIEEVDASTTYYCRAWQNSGSALSCRCYLRAVRIV